ncbi:MAG: ATP-binding protein [Deferribacterales bacterium]|jgi:DNA polymerase-3 subunit delta'
MIVGHKKEIDIFKNIIDGGKLHHAYIFSGREGSGKKLFAKELARSVICADGTYMQPCQCRHCRVLTGSEHPDIHMIEESPVKIEVARQISNDAFMSPLSAKKKIYIIDNAHTFTKEAANAVLKTLEEPPADTHFFLITDRYEHVLPTIRSRCINIRFSSLTNDEVEQVLMQSGVLDTAGVAEHASGSVSYAQYLLENIDESGRFSPDKDRSALYAEISNLDTKEKIRAYCASMYTYMLEKYKENSCETLLDFSNYLLDILKRLEYNVSLDMFRMDLYVKTAEVLCEKS